MTDKILKVLQNAQEFKIIYLPIKQEAILNVVVQITIIQCVVIRDLNTKTFVIFIAIMDIQVIAIFVLQEDKD